ncbi:MAG TPA: hypothetical protein DC064_21135 [Cyanobacteria bacterium UBA9273]|nr:hypothetical protein [Cyanobacteria bacterium UBA9273]
MIVHFKHYLTPEQADQVSVWLREAIEETKETGSSDKQQKNLEKAEISILPVGNFAQGRIKLIGQLNFKIENGIKASIIESPMCYF